MKAVPIVLLAVVLNSCGPAPIPGPQGEPGIQGERGEPGAVGATGAPGNDGQDGKDATPVTVVQLCPGTTTYPSKFIEYVICLQGNFYGVYSENGGFLALLPPGTYFSNGINSTCNVAIGPNCTLSR